MTLVDTNVLIDILAANPPWREWSLDEIDRRSLIGPVVINEIIYAELSAQYASQDDVDSIIARFDLMFENVPRQALHRAGRAFARYRAAGGTRTSVMPDFFIGAHAASAGSAILTRDARRYRSYFPEAEVIAPE